MKTYIKEILDKREHLDNDNHAMFSEAICKKVKAFDEYKQAKTLLILYHWCKTQSQKGKMFIFPKY